MYTLNKIAYWLMNPFCAAIVGISMALVIKWGGMVFVKDARRRRITFVCSWALIALCLVWMWVWSIKATYWVVGGWLEEPYVMLSDIGVGKPLAGREWEPRAGNYPVADAIVLLGGGMGGHTNGCVYAEMYGPADRVWHAARLYRAGRADKIFATGPHVRTSTGDFLVDLGVPTNATVFISSPRNTEEEAKCIAKLLTEGLKVRDPRILLVTSAWHMRRAELMFKKYATELKVIPAPTDFEATKCITYPDGIWLTHFLPDPDAMARNCVMFKELIGLAGYTLFR